MLKKVTDFIFHLTHLALEFGVICLVFYVPVTSHCSRLYVHLLDE